MQKLHNKNNGEGKQQRGCMGMEETLMAMQQPIEDGTHTYGEKIDHKEGKQLGPEDELLCFKVREKS